MQNIKNSIESLANILVEEESEENLAQKILEQETTYKRLTKLVKPPLLTRLTRTIDPQKQQEYKKIHLILYTHKAAHARKTGDEQAYNQFIQEANNYKHA